MANILREPSSLGGRLMAANVARLADDSSGTQKRVPVIVRGSACAARDSYYPMRVGTDRLNRAAGEGR